MTEDRQEGMTLEGRLQPLVQGNLRGWTGLPPISVVALNAVFGQPASEEKTMLGWLEATRYIYEQAPPRNGVAAYVRDGDVVMLEALSPPPLSAMEGLGEPCAIKPHEILVSGAYVHEYLYCGRGLVLSIAEPFDKEKPWRLVRCRGIHPLRSPEDFGTSLYMAFEDRQAW